MSESTATSEPRVYRRKSTVVTGYVFAGIIAVIAIILTVPVIGHGIWPALAAPVVGATLVLITYVMSVKPSVVVRDQGVEVHNSFASFDVSYGAIDEVRQTRMGLVLHTKAGRNIALTGYANGMGGRVVGHKEAADALIEAVETGQRLAGHAAKSEAKKAAVSEDDGAMVTRRWDPRMLIAVPGAMALSVLVVVAAAHTYS
jgi:hypothetical protein